jgi:excisionase family DNA binding protein
MDVSTLAKYSNLSERTLRTRLRDDLPHVRIGRSIRVSRTAFDDWMWIHSVAVREQLEPSIRASSLLEEIRASRPRRRGVVLDDRLTSSSHEHVVKSSYGRTT